MPKINVIQARFAVIFLKEEEYIVAYCPALELSSYGKSEQEAKKAFEEAMQIFFEETQRKGSLERVLIRLGWNLLRTNYEPPTYSPEELFKLYKTKPVVNVTTQQVSIPMAARAY